MTRFRLRLIAGVAALAWLAGAQMPCASAQEPKKAHIYGLAGVRIYVSDATAARRFYKEATNTGRACDWCERSEPAGFKLPSGQFLLISSRDRSGQRNLLAEISFNADHLEELRRRLKAEKIDTKTEGAGRGDISVLRVRDPEGHALAFLNANSPRQYRAYHPQKERASAKKERIIHAGFVVKDRAAMDHFYKDILGFHVYWHGGMKDGETDWVDMQVPDGTDWIEYMLNIPEDADKRTLGVMNHIALGVPDVRAAAEELKKSGATLGEQPQIGRDGKWQLNLYDPDGTRVELMEFTPVEKACCSEYTGPHPKP